MILQEFINEIKRFGGFGFLNLHLGTYKGTVINNEDPESRGRLKLQCDTVLGRGVTSTWAEPDGMGANRWDTPQPGDKVWVWFEAGNRLCPVWRHGWPLQGKAAGNTKQTVYRSPAGSNVTFDDKAGTVNLAVAGGGAAVTLQKDGTVTIEGGGATMEIAPTGAVTFTAAGGARLFISATGIITAGSGTGAPVPVVKGPQLIAILTQLIALTATSVVQVAGLPAPLPLSNALAIGALAAQLPTIVSTTLFNAD